MVWAVGYFSGISSAMHREDEINLAAAILVGDAGGHDGSEAVVQTNLSVTAPRIAPVNISPHRSTTRSQSVSNWRRSRVSNPSVA